MRAWVCLGEEIKCSWVAKNLGKLFYVNKVMKCKITRSIIRLQKCAEKRLFFQVSKESGKKLLLSNNSFAKRSYFSSFYSRQKE